MKDPLVFLPGMMCDARLFGPQIAALSPELPVTVAPISHGDRIEEIASGLLDQLPHRFALAGFHRHHHGGLVRRQCGYSWQRSERRAGGAGRSGPAKLPASRFPG